MQGHSWCTCSASKHTHLVNAGDGDGAKEFSANVQEFTRTLETRVLGVIAQCTYSTPQRK